MDRHPGLLVDARGDTRLRDPADAVLRRVERDQRQVRHAAQQVDRAASLAIDAGLVRDEPHAFAAHESGQVLDEDLDAGADGGRRGARQGGCDEQGCRAFHAFRDMLRAADGGRRGARQGGCDEQGCRAFHAFRDMLRAAA